MHLNGSVTHEAFGGVAGTTTVAFCYKFCYFKRYSIVASSLDAAQTKSAYADTLPLFSSPAITVIEVLNHVTDENG